MPSPSRVALYQIALLLALLALWEAGVALGWLPVFLYGRPSGVIAKGWQLILSGELARDAALTAWEAIAGFAIGTVLGSAAGLTLWLFPTGAAVLRPYMIALNGLPKIALAPLIIVWFGIGLGSKIAIAAIITFIVALITAQQGAKEVDADLVKLMRSLGASRLRTWRTVIVPGAMPWIVSAFRLNVGFALIGAVVGEYIASKEGLGYMIYYAGVLYDLNAVWVGIAALMGVALAMYGVIDLIERRLRA
ncbi:NitT/TauT family transport system permease protein [Azorhizobium sp. AG788]|uniref:ABC transporter permease n=1 Tax=Azorhizobium sp. AG788 TaxID=2183897 RepID=UPI00105E49A5|nr:ABC transporter permease [Azorhizobium sp. AG788]TDT99658.1 NitT/TauT family transport system permease protein [Azorhizobium sp. AG788]